MTVTAQGENAGGGVNTVWCDWFDDNKVISGVFPCDAVIAE